MRPLKFLLPGHIPVASVALIVSTAIITNPHFVSSARAQNADIAANGTVRALSLRQKWTAGQQLSYGVSLSGTMSAQASPHTPSMFAGIPMDIDVRLEGDTTLDTLAVDDLGTGTVAVRVGRLLLRAETFGQKGEFALRDGKANMTLNGKRLGGNRPLDAKAFSEPEFAFLISDRGRLTSAVPIKKPTSKASVAEDANPVDARVPQGLPFDPASFAQSMLWRVVPNLWPQLPVKAGEKWSAEVQWPVDELARIAAQKSGHPQSEVKAGPLSIGKIDFTLMGEEEVGGHKTVRIALDGTFALDEAKGNVIKGSIDGLGTLKQDAAKDAVPNGKAAPANSKPDSKAARERQWQSKLERANQKVTGNVWFDPQAGHVVRAELKLLTQASARDVVVGESKDGENKKAVNGAAAKTPNADEPDAWLDFSGTLQLQLKNVQQKNVVAQPATAAPAGNA